MSELPVTGERVIEGAYHSSPGLYAIYLMHLASYRFALPFVAGKRVLDLGCGSGYGAALVAETAREVVAVDISEEAIRYASAHHARGNLRHDVVGADEALPFQDRSFDVVLSFQVIEHVERDLDYVAEAGRVLVDGGILIVITPNRDVRLLPTQKPWNRWHLREYDAASLSRLFDPDKFGVEMKFMTASPRLANMELSRYRRLKWLTLPITLPFMPKSWRMRALNLLHALDREPVSKTHIMLEPPFDESDIQIGTTRLQALNLVAVASKCAIA